MLRPFLAVQTSFWPFLLALAIFSFITRFLLYVNLKLSLYFVTFTFFTLFFIAFLWWKDFMRESILGYHTHKLEVRLRVSILLFILSEIFFFVRFFWAFFDSSFSPCVEIGILWPPLGISPFSVYSIPLLNTIILLTRGITVTWAHHALIGNYFNKTVIGLFFTVVLGIYFLIMQWAEYAEASFSIADGVYGSTFFIATGFHGIHVLIGTIFLLVVFLWACIELNNLFSQNFN